MKKLLTILTLFSLFFLISCAKDEDDGAAVGGLCLTDGEETCSTDSSEILVCKDSFWESKKTCRTHLGEYCRQTASGSYSCSETEIADSGDSSDSDTSNTGDSSDTDTTDSDNNDTTPPQPDNDTTPAPSDDNNTDTTDNDTAEGDNDPAEDSDIPQPADEDADIPQPADEDTDTPDEDTAPADPCDPNPCAGKMNSTEVCTKDGENYTCGCIAGYEWKGASCEETNETICKGLGDGAKWEENKCIKTTPCETFTDEHAVWWNDIETETYVSTYDFTTEEWSVVQTEYSTEEGACHFKCNTNYFWEADETKCVNPCEPDTGNPCREIANTDDEHTCTPQNATEYECTCKNDYFWADGNCRLPLPLGNICTGQNKCYDNTAELECPASESEDFFGQDWFYANDKKTCTPQSFKVKTASNGDKIVIDNNTGLIWKKTVDTGKSWSQAKDLCKGSSYANLSGWRLPKPHELLTIIDSNRAEPAFVEHFSVNNYVWTDIKKSSSDGYYVINRFGILESAAANNGYNVICVRSDISDSYVLAEASLTVSGEEGSQVVTDSATGLMWQNKISSSKMTWKNALAYCETEEGSNYAGHSDWRLPNRNELASLVNYSNGSDPRLYPNSPDVKSNDFWTSTTYANNKERAIRVEFYSGKINGNSSKNMSNQKNSVICVRNDDSGSGSGDENGEGEE